MKKSTITISCSECGKNITLSADDVNIRWKFNGGCPGNLVTVKCSHCGKNSTVKQTPEAEKLLAKKLQPITY